MAKFVPLRSCLRDVGGMNVCRDCIPLFQRESGPMRLLQIPTAMPLLPILPVRARVLQTPTLLAGQRSAGCRDYVQLFRRAQVVQRKTNPYNSHRLAPILQCSYEVILI